MDDEAYGAQQATELTVEVLGVDNTTGLPQPVEVRRDALRAALINNPAVLIGALRELLERAVRPAGGEVSVASNTTAIRDLLAPGEYARLSPRAQQLTRGDLLALGGWSTGRKTPEQLGLTVQDVKDLRDVFAQQIGAEFLPQGVSISGCCCSPCCCCAAAVVHPVPSLA